jgi:hypothetical protein
MFRALGLNSAEAVNFGGLILALVAAIIALWQGRLLRKQIETDQRTTQTDLYFRVANSFRDLDLFFVDHPELRPFFYQNKKLPRSGRKRAQLSAAAEMVVDLAESVIACGPGLGALAVDWHKYFAFLYRNSEALRKYWKEYSYYYPDAVREAFQAPVQGIPPAYMTDHRTRSPWKSSSSE